MPGDAEVFTMTEEAMWTSVIARFPKESFPRGGGSGLFRQLARQRI